MPKPLTVLSLYIFIYIYLTHYDFTDNCSIDQKNSTVLLNVFIYCICKRLTVLHTEYTDGYKNTTGQCGAVCAHKEGKKTPPTELLLKTAEVKGKEYKQHLQHW